MQIAKNRTMATLIALFLMLTIAFTLVALPNANAQTGVTKNTFPIIGALPNPVGVGQQTLILAGITHATAWPQPGWYKVTVTVTKPDGTTETLGPVTTDTTGMTGITYTPAKAGTYYLQTNFPEQKIEYTAAGTLANTTMKASTSDKLPLIVTEEPRQYYPGVPLPTEYWTRPINAQFREWTPIAGNWLNVLSYGNRLPPDNDDAPETAHLLWAMKLAEGGLVGEIDPYATNIDAISYEHGDAYEGKWSNPIIMNGVLFYVRQASQSMVSQWANWTSTVQQTTVAVDLHTGEVLWEKVLGDNERQAFGQIFYWKTMNMYGAFSYLWTTVGSTWNAYDPFTGRWEYNITGVPSGSRIVGPNGEILVYSINFGRGATQTTGWMTMWNSTRAVHQTYWDFYKSRPTDAVFADYYADRWRPHGITFNGSVGIQWNVTIPKGLAGAVEGVVGTDRILGSNTSWAGGLAEPNPVFWAISIKPGQEGRVLFNETWKLPTTDAHADIPGSLPVSLDDGVFVVSIKETRTHYGLSLDTGKQLWGPTSPAEPYLNVFTNLYMNPWGQAVIKYGKLFTAGMGGVVNAYNVKTGEHLWTYNNTDPYTEQLFSENWPTPITFIVDGKIYLCHQEHSANTPVPRGAPTVCINATTGEVIWRIDGLRLGTRWGGQPIIGDSIIAAFSSYDNRIVAIGKGPSATTVTASPKVSVHGSSVLVEGMVTDVSPGTKDSALTMRFPNGVPAVSDASMSDWMKYVYMQFPRPMNATGVEVVISVLDPNNNYYEVGRTTSDATGMFKLMFTPEVPGEYTFVVTFAGSEAYYGSFAETAIGVDEAPVAPAAPEPAAPLPPYETYTIGTGIAIIIAVAIVGLMLLRKKP